MQNFSTADIGAKIQEVLPTKGRPQMGLHALFLRAWIGTPVFWRFRKRCNQSELAAMIPQLPRSSSSLPCFSVFGEEVANAHSQSNAKKSIPSIMEKMSSMVALFDEG